MGKMSADAKNPQRGRALEIDPTSLEKNTDQKKVGRPREHIFPTIKRRSREFSILERGKRRLKKETLARSLGLTLGREEKGGKEGRKRLERLG